MFDRFSVYPHNFRNIAPFLQLIAIDFNIAYTRTCDHDHKMRFSIVAQEEHIHTKYEKSDVLHCTLSVLTLLYTIFDMDACEN
jgi:hypothetical protein